MKNGRSSETTLSTPREQVACLSGRTSGGARRWPWSVRDGNSDSKTRRSERIKAVCFPCAVAGRMNGLFDGTGPDQPDEIWTTRSHSSESGETVAPGVSGSSPVGRPTSSSTCDSPRNFEGRIEGRIRDGRSHCVDGRVYRVGEPGGGNHDEHSRDERGRTDGVEQSRSGSSG